MLKTTAKLILNTVHFKINKPKKKKKGSFSKTVSVATITTQQEKDETQI